MKKWLIRIVILLIVLIGAVFLVGALLPEEHHASRTLITKQSPQALWDAINDHAKRAAMAGRRCECDIAWATRGQTCLAGEL